ncbi:hypothetical protein BGX24_007730, partial [Mortierella sp. AD032]
VAKQYEEFENRIRHNLSTVPKAAFTLDGWTSPFQMSFLTVTAHCNDDDWEQQDVTLGFEQLKGKHTGEALMQAFIKVVRLFHLQWKIMSITSDNGSNVLKMMTALAAFTLAHPEQ